MLPFCPLREMLVRQLTPVVPQTLLPLLPITVHDPHEPLLKASRVISLMFQVRSLESSERIMGAHLAVFPDTPQTLHVADAWVRLNYQRQGIGSAFYTVLASYARTQHFRFIAGQNDSENIAFYLSLGRARLSEVKDCFRDFMFSRWVSNTLNEDDINHCSVLFLQEEDRRRMLKPSK